MRNGSIFFAVFFTFFSFPPERLGLSSHAFTKGLSHLAAGMDDHKNRPKTFAGQVKQAWLQHQFMILVCFGVRAARPSPASLFYPSPRPRAPSAPPRPAPA